MTHGLADDVIDTCERGVDLGQEPVVLVIVHVVLVQERRDLRTTTHTLETVGNLLYGLLQDMGAFLSPLRLSWLFAACMMRDTDKGNLKCKSGSC